MSSFTSTVTSQPSSDKDETPEEEPQNVPELEQYDESELDEVFARLEQPKA